MILRVALFFILAVQASDDRPGSVRDWSGKLRSWNQKTDAAKAEAVLLSPQSTSIDYIEAYISIYAAVRSAEDSVLSKRLKEKLFGSVFTYDMASSFLPKTDTYSHVLHHHNALLCAIMEDAFIQDSSGCARIISGAVDGCGDVAIQPAVFNAMMVLSEAMVKYGERVRSFMIKLCGEVEERGEEEANYHEVFDLKQHDNNDRKRIFLNCMEMGFAALSGATYSSAAFKRAMNTFRSRSVGKERDQLSRMLFTLDLELGAMKDFNSPEPNDTLLRRFEEYLQNSHAFQHLQLSILHLYEHSVKSCGSAEIAVLIKTMNWAKMVPTAYTTEFDVFWFDEVKIQIERLLRLMSDSLADRIFDTYLRDGGPVEGERYQQVYDAVDAAEVITFENNMEAGGGDELLHSMHLMRWAYSLKHHLQMARGKHDEAPLLALLDYVAQLGYGRDLFYIDNVIRPRLIIKVNKIVSTALCHVGNVSGCYKAWKHLNRVHPQLPMLSKRALRVHRVFARACSALLLRAVSEDLPICGVLEAILREYFVGPFVKEADGTLQTCLQMILDSVGVYSDKLSYLHAATTMLKCKSTVKRHLEEESLSPMARLLIFIYQSVHDYMAGIDYGGIPDAEPEAISKVIHDNSILVRVIYQTEHRDISEHASPLIYCIARDLRRCAGLSITDLLAAIVLLSKFKPHSSMLLLLGEMVRETVDGLREELTGTMMTVDGGVAALRVMAVYVNNNDQLYHGKSVIFKYYIAYTLFMLQKILHRMKSAYFMYTGQSLCRAVVPQSTIDTAIGRFGARALSRLCGNLLKYHHIYDAISGVLISGSWRPLPVTAAVNLLRLTPGNPNMTQHWVWDVVEEFKAAVGPLAVVGPFGVGVGVEELVERAEEAVRLFKLLPAFDIGFLD